MLPIHTLKKVVVCEGSTNFTIQGENTYRFWSSLNTLKTLLLRMNFKYFLFNTGVIRYFIEKVWCCWVKSDSFSFIQEWFWDCIVTNNLWITKMLVYKFLKEQFMPISFTELVKIYIVTCLDKNLMNLGKIHHRWTYGFCSNKENHVVPQVI